MNVLASDRSLTKPQARHCPSQRAERTLVSAPTRRLPRVDLPIDSNQGIRNTQSVRLNLLSFMIGTSHPGRMPHAFSHPPAHRLY